MFYNHFFKEEFIDTIENGTTKRVYASIFNKAKALEENFDKDLYNFTTKEIQVLLFSFNTGQKNTLSAYLNQLRLYTDYAIEIGVKGSNINPYKTFTHTDLVNYLVEYKRKYVSFDEYVFALEEVYNHIDYALFLALFEGIGGFEYSEVTNMTKQDVAEAESNPVFENGEKRFVIKLHGTNREQEEVERQITISNELLKALQQAGNQLEYYTGNGEGTKLYTVRPMFDNNYVFRKIENSNTTSEQIDKQFVYRKLTLLSELTEGLISSLTTIVDSGIIYNLSRLAQDEEVGMEEAEQTMLQYNKAISTYSPNSSFKGLLKKHQKALQDLYGVKIAA